MKLLASLIRLPHVQLILGADCMITGAVAIIQLVFAEWLSPWLGISSAIAIFRVLACLIYVYAERVQLTPFGLDFILVQVMAVSVFGVLEYLGSRMPQRKESQI